MKCEKCHEKEANFYYSAYINGEKSQRHLCEHCAREEGYGRVMDYRPRDMFADLEGFFADFFAPQPSLLSSFGSFGHPLRAMMSPLLSRPLSEASEAECVPGEGSEHKIPAQAGEEIRRRRELAALKEQLAQAVASENFEQAITLRDEIRRREN